MKVEEIKEALEYYRAEIWDKDDLEVYKRIGKKENYDYIKHKSDCATIALKALQNELERIENKPKEV